MDELLTVAEVAQRLKVSEETVRRRCRHRTWEAAKIGRFYRFTHEQYEAILAPPRPAEAAPRSQKDRIKHLLRRV